MIITVLVWLYIFTILTAFGLIFNKISEYIFKTNFERKPNINQLIFNGFCLSMTICSFLYFYMNIGLLVHSLFLGVSISTFYFLKSKWIEIYNHIIFKSKSLTIYNWGLVLICFLSILISTIEQPTNIDTGNYHAQSIKWINEHPIIPGIGNLLGNLAYNQSNFLVEGLFSLSFISNNPLRILNGFLVLVLTLKIVSNISFRKNEFNSVQFVGCIIITFFFIYYKNWISSPSPDIVVTLFTYYIFYEIFQKLTSNQALKLDNTIISIYFIAISSLTVKLSALVLPLIAIVLILRTPNILTSKNITYFIVFPLIIITPWLVRNVIFSGYLIFPFPALDLFNVDWKIPKELVQGVKNAIHGFSFSSNYDSNELMTLSLLERSKIWFSETAWYRISFISLVIGSLFYYLWLFISKGSLSKNKVTLIIIALTSFAGIVFWFLSAPDFRFGSALIYMSIAIFTVLILPKKIYHQRFFSTSLILLTVFFFFRKMQIQEVIKHPISPAKYSSVVTSEYKADNFIYFIPNSNYQCWDHQLPCVPFGDLQRVQLRGNSIEDGFKFIKKGK